MTSFTEPPSEEGLEAPEISAAISENIASWRRTAANLNPAADKRTFLRNATRDLVRSLKIDATVRPHLHAASRQATFDFLAEVAEFDLGIPSDEAQAIFAEPSETNGHNHQITAQINGLGGYSEIEPPPHTEVPDGETVEARQQQSSAPPADLPLTISQWMDRDLPEPDFLLGHVFTTTSRALLVGPTGLGKTNFLLQLAMNCAAGVSFLSWQGRRMAKVLYIDGEMSRRLFKQRIADTVKRLGNAPIGFHALSHEDIEGFAPINTAQGQACIDAVIDRIGVVDLIVLDSIMCLTAGDMKDGEAWRETIPYVRSLTRRNIGQIWAHHTGHDESKSYGDKTKEWQLDTVMHMEAVRRDDTDVSFNLEFRKARERTPATRADFQTVKVALVGDEWRHEGSEVQHSGRATPLALKFRDALVNVLASDLAIKVGAHPAAKDDDWKAECVRLGLIDPQAKPNSARALFSKNKRELVAAHRVFCDGEVTWI